MSDLIVIQPQVTTFTVTEDVNQVIVSSVGVQGPTGATGGTTSLGHVSPFYYGAVFAQSSVNATLNRCYFVPVFIPATGSYDRLQIRAGASFNGTATARLGIYSDTNGQPATLILDAGTVSVTAASTNYTITINQSLTSGWYWLATGVQATATNTSLATTASSIPATSLGLPRDSVTANAFGGYYVDGISGAFANISSGWTESNFAVLCAIRKA
jgi:hypothetical protein